MKTFDTVVAAGVIPDGLPRAWGTPEGGTAYNARQAFGAFGVNNARRSRTSIIAAPTNTVSETYGESVDAKLYAKIGVDMIQ